MASYFDMNSYNNNGGGGGGGPINMQLALVP
jgi:hypothetical protein